MRVLTFLSQKGGVGKSVLATQLSVVATQADDLVGIVDIDPQGSAFLWKAHRKKNVPIVLRALPEKLPDVMDEASRLGVTVMMVDTPPHTDKVALSVVRLSDFIVCPTKPELFSLGALADTVKLLDLAQSKSRSIAVINDLPPKGDARTNALETAIAVLKKFDMPIAETTVDHSQAIVAAIEEGKGVTETAPRAKDAKQIRALWAEIIKQWPATRRNGEST
jgi:chromosome partitioning protein